LIAVTKIESLATRALDFAFTSEEEMGTIGMTGKVGDVGDSRYCASRLVLPFCQANVGRSYQNGHAKIRGALLISEFIYCIQ
jgi:hypothetical protein